ncbi:PREDICTED: zinc finger, partial [Prunus dulcis]
RCRIACVKMIIRDELPFSHVEGIGFCEFLKEAQPRFDFPSRTTIARDVWDLYQEEKAKINSDGNLLHVRCCAHITNLIVTNGKKEIHQSIESIRNCAKYIRGSSQRLEKFRACLEMEKVDTRTMVPLDVCARWNSTYMMLESALKLQKGFERMEEDDPNFLGYFEEYEAHGKEKKKRVGPPTSLDWDNTKVFVKFLKKFYDATLRFSASKT